ncbi:TonB-dependent receptor domain-containing protein [Marinicella gelatinilytica]|uniref:TonB-dependent receptor domain-containing protein n=1 Tax=Marinicella gelatinilytica TaxID=2996017 RepID=UPI002260A248|nr:TonB-dependent receptor [Marinicella gelatinilytica]MCX7544733.1 TonB-dependent receptor [Marinicella gelatinilytica]
MKTILFLMGCLLAASTLAAEHSISGQLLLNKKPVKQAVIYIHQQNVKTISDNQGYFEFSELSPGDYDLDIKADSQHHYNVTVSFNRQRHIIELSELVLDDLVVSAHPLDHNQLRMTMPVEIIDEDQLVMNRSLSIDQTVNQIAGIQSGSFGTGAGQVVIRGQQGPRVSVLSNGIGNQDAASVSPDHWVSSESLLATQVEVIKGPATLLYGGGAVGGLVNVVDQSIATSAYDGFNGAFEGRLSDSALDERAGVLSLNAPLSDRLMAHLSYFYNETDDYEIPGYAESHYLRDLMHADEEHGEEDEEHEYGQLANSAVRSSGLQTGLSWLTDSGYWGISFQNFDRKYGIPGHNHLEEDDGDHDDHGVAKEEHDDMHESHRVWIDLDKQAFQLRGLHRFDGGFFTQVKSHYGYTDYQHIEFDNGDPATTYSNEGHQWRLELNHQHRFGFDGVWGLDWSTSDFSALGHEAYIVPSTTDKLGLFVLEERQFGDLHWELGIRADRQKISTDLWRDNSETAVSFSTGFNVKLSEHFSLPIHLSSAQRLPTAEELFSNQSGNDELIPHLATGSFEVGNPALQAEVSNNLDVGLKYRKDQWAANLNAFYNQMDDFIFLAFSGQMIDDWPVYHYSQQNATFKGFEADIAYSFDDVYNNQWRVKLFTDATTAKLNTGDYVPRIPANRFGVSADWWRGAWSAQLKTMRVNKQDHLASGELPTDAYTQVDFSLNRLQITANNEWLWFIKGSNLLNEDIREHASFIKDKAPRPGRSITAGLRVSF